MTVVSEILWENLLDYKKIFWFFREKMMPGGKNMAILFCFTQNKTCAG
jgi:hypothetical protein